MGADLEDRSIAGHSAKSVNSWAGLDCCTSGFLVSAACRITDARACSNALVALARRAAPLCRAFRAGPRLTPPAIRVDARRFATPTNLPNARTSLSCRSRRLAPFSGCAAALGVGSDARWASCLSRDAAWLRGWVAANGRQRSRGRGAAAIARVRGETCAEHAAQDTENARRPTWRIRCKPPRWCNP